MTNLDSILKIRDITLPTKVHLVKAVVFPVVIYRCESWDYKESWVPKNGCFWTVLEKTFESPLDCKEIKQSISKEIDPEYSQEGLMLKLKLQYFGHLMWKADTLLKTLMQEKGMTEDVMVGWHQWFNGHEFKQAPRVGEGQGGLECCSPWGRKESDSTVWLNNNKCFFYFLTCWSP